MSKVSLAPALPGASRRNRTRTDKKMIYLPGRITPSSQARAEGKTVLFLPSYDHVDVIEGHGGLMLEVETQCQSSSVWGRGGKPDVILCPIGGGGLISGVSLGAKGVYGDEMVVIGVEPSGELPSFPSQ
jgi:threonine dehydratase